jgi:hypothetical protein
MIQYLRPVNLHGAPDFGGVVAIQIPAEAQQLVDGERQQDGIDVADELRGSRQTLGVAPRNLVEPGPAQAPV